MLEIFGKNYYIDIDSINEKCQIQGDEIVEKDNDENEETPVIQINIFKYEIIKMCIDRVFAEFDDEEDDKLFKSKNMTTSFSLAFNTLINYEIIKEKDE